MSYINSKYTRRISLNKTIQDIVYEGDGYNSQETRIVFTDGTYLSIYPHIRFERTERAVSWKPEILVAGYYKDSQVIAATMED